MEKLSKPEIKEIPTIMWSLWLRRNEFIFEGKFKSPSQVVRIAKDGLKEFQLAQQTLRKSQGSNEERRKLTWKKPRENYVKAN